jgi:hypothetical protein
MLPDQLTPESFAGYPPQARELATRQIAILRRLPLAFVPLLLRELIVYDWKFPAERVDLDRQFMYLEGLAPGSFRAAMSAFAELKVTRELEKVDWVNSPAIFSEQFSAHLWATHQIDAFRAAAVDYVRKSSASAPDPLMPTHRLGIAVIGQGMTKSDYRLFRKLRPKGVYYTQVKHAGGAQRPTLSPTATGISMAAHRWRRRRALRGFRMTGSPPRARYCRTACRKRMKRRSSIPKLSAR